MYARTAAPARPRIGVFGVIYLVVGVAIASAVLAVLLWPLLLLGINLHIH